MKNFAFVLLLLTPFLSKAQLNTSFEEWTNNGPYENLKSWSTPNAFYSLNNMLSATKQAPHWGQFALGISPVALPGITDSIPGYIFQKNSINKRHGSVSIYYRYPCMKTDSPSLIISYYKGPLDTANIIGSCILTFGAHKEWTRLSGDIQWKNSEIPDSFTIIIVNAANNSSDTLFVDDLEISDFRTGISDIHHYSEPRIFVTSDRQVILKNLEGQDKRLVMRNMLGEILFSEYIDNTASLQDFDAGLYILELHTTEGISTQKIVLY